VYAMLYGMERPKKEGADDPSNPLRMLIAGLLLEPVPGQIEFQVSAGAPHSLPSRREADGCYPRLCHMLPVLTHRLGC
jgi:hypothetical protein